MTNQFSRTINRAIERAALRNQQKGGHYVVVLVDKKVFDIHNIRWDEWRYIVDPTQ